MAEFKCDSCQKITSDKDKYKLRCSGECRRHFCMSCTGLDKMTTKMLCQQKYHNIRFFCSVCDSPTLKYLHDKVSQLQKGQIPLEIVEALGACLKNSEKLHPVISEIYDTLSAHDSRWSDLSKKVDDIHNHHSEYSESGQQSLFHSIREMKRDLCNISSIFMDGHDESIKVQVHDSSKEELTREMADLRKCVNQMALTLEKLAGKEKPSTRSSPPPVKKSITASISTQTDSEETSPVTQVVIDSRVCPPPQNSALKENWHYVVVSKIPHPFTAKQLAHFVKEKLGTTEFIRCFPMLQNKDCSHTDFKVGVQNKNHLKQLLDRSMWPPGTGIETANSSATLLKASPPSAAITVDPQHQSHHHFKPNTAEGRSRPLNSDSTPINPTKDDKTIRIGSDREAIAVSKSLALDSTKIVMDTSRKKDESIMDPMTPPIVRLSRASDTADGRYLLARLRDPAILKALRLFLAYLHDQPSTVCFDGHTNTSIKLMLASEGLPSDLDSLRKLYFRFHNAYGIGLAEVDADLSAFRSYFSSEKLLRLQNIRESQSKYFSSGSPRNNKNF